MRHSLLLLIFALLLLIPGTASLPLMDRDEPRFAQATWEMMETEQWVIPYFHGEYRFDKPPLTYWWMRVHYLLLGKGEFTARLHSILAAALTAIVIARLGTFLYSKEAGVLAGLGFLTCLQTLVHGRLCVADMIMILGVCATMDAMARYLLRAPNAPPGEAKAAHFLYLVVALALGFLAKGPIAWIVPCLALALFIWPFGRGAVKDRLARVRRIPWFLSFGLATGICLLWAVPALVQTGGRFFDVGIGTHVIERGLQPFNGRVTIPGVYYLATIVPSLLPWSAFTWQALFRGGLPRGDEKRSLLLAWYLAPFLIFSFYSTQLPHYVMPGFAAFFLLLFRNGRLPQLTSRKETITFSVVVALTLTTCLTGTLFLLFTQDRLDERVRELLPVMFLGLGAIAFVGGFFPLLVALASRTVRPERGTGSRALRILRCLWLPLIFLAGTSAITCNLAAQIREVNLVTRVENRLQEHDGISRIISHDFGEPSLVFYLPEGAALEFGSGIEGMSSAGLDAENDIVLLARSRTWGIFDAFLTTPHLPKLDRKEEILSRFKGNAYRIESVEGFNPARTTWEEILLISRES